MVKLTMLKRAKYLYGHSFTRYLLVGFTTFTVDIVILYILHEHLFVSIPISTSVAYWVSVLYNFSLTRWWTFSASSKNSLRNHAMAYGVLLAFNYVFTVLFVTIGSRFIYFALAKIIAVGITVTWTYLIYKNYIFNK